MGKELKIIGFAAAVCLVCSLLLATVYSRLHVRQEQNKALDMKMKVLGAFGVNVGVDIGRDQVEATFRDRVEGRILNSAGERIEGLTIEDLSPEEINDRDPATGLKKYYPYYVFSAGDDEALYAIHVSGMGLWSVVKAYLALEDDYATIAGVAFYDHAETPGLGGEVDKPWFQDQFKGKKLYADGAVKYFEVVKPSAEADESAVHGPSGATMTSKGITSFINRDFAVYNKYFESRR